VCIKKKCPAKEFSTAAPTNFGVNRKSEHTYKPARFSSVEPSKASGSISEDGIMVLPDVLQDAGFAAISGGVTKYDFTQGVPFYFI